MVQFENQNDEGRANSCGSEGTAFLRWMIVVLILAVVLLFVLSWAKRALPSIAIAEISELTNTNIDVNSVDFYFDGSVFIEQLTIRPGQVAQYDNAILKAETVYARFSIGSLLLLGPRLKEICVNDFVFDAQYSLDSGRWNIAALKLKVPKGRSAKMPLIELKRGKLRYSKVSNGQVEVAASVPIDARLEFDEQTNAGYTFNVKTARLSGGYGDSNLTGSWRPGRITLAGGISSTDIPELDWSWAIDVLAAELAYDPNNDYSLALRVKDLHTSLSPSPDTFELVKPAFLESSGSFTALQEFLRRYRPAGTVDIDLATSGNLGRLSQSRLDGRVYCKNVSICDRRFPYPIEHLTGQVDFTESSAILKELSGEHGDVKLTIQGRSNSFGPDWQCRLYVASDNMTLDNELYDALDAQQRKFWDTFSPSGSAALEYRFNRQSQTEKSETVTIDLLDAEATYRHFPYPLQGLTGKVRFDRSTMVVSDVVSQTDGSKITLNARVTELGSDRPVYYVSVKAKDVPLDSTLVAALPAEQRQFCEQFDMSGLIDAEVMFFPPEQQDGQAGFLADVSVKDASLKVGKSPIVVSGISAETVVTPDSVRIKDFTGQYEGSQPQNRAAGVSGQSPVSVVGVIWLTDKAHPSHYSVKVSAKQAELNEGLIGLLPAPLEKVASNLQPKGAVDFSAELTKAVGDDHPEHKIVVDCLGDSISSKRFVYPLKDVTGRLTVEGNRITLGNIVAVPAGGVQLESHRPTIKVNGQIALAAAPNNSQNGNPASAFDSATLRLSASDIIFDEQLETALSEAIAPLYQELSPSGRFDLDLKSLEIRKADDGQKHIVFDGGAKLKGCNFNVCGTRAELDAALNAKGSYKTGSGFSEGQVNLVADRVQIKGKSITGLNGDINYDPHTRSWSADDVIGDCHGGRLIARIELTQPAKRAFAYVLQGAFADVDLARFLKGARLEARPPAARGTAQNGPTRGTMDGSLSVGVRIGLPTVGGRGSSRIGRCRLTVRDMKVGKVSSLAKLLYVLKLTEPKDFAFEQMVVDSYMKDGELFFEKFDLSGEALAFYGSGRMDLLSENVDLALTVRGPRLAAAEPSLVQALAEGIGGAVVRMEVTGPYYDPQVRIRTLPVIKDSLQILQKRR